jgi:hypothetical protein
MMTETILAISYQLSAVSKKQAKVQTKVKQILVFLNLNLILLAMSYQLMPMNLFEVESY